jgi:hypothetical protein
MFVMFAKVKSPVFIDSLHLELLAKKTNHISGIIRDEQGSVCRRMERNLPRDQHEVTWGGLNDLPYGIYTLELSHGDDEMRMNLVKRV